MIINHSLGGTSTCVFFLRTVRHKSTWDELSRKNDSWAGPASSLVTLFFFFNVFFHRWGLPSGKRLHNYGKSPYVMGKSTMSMAIFNSYLCLPEGKFSNVVFLMVFS